MPLTDINPLTKLKTTGLTELKEVSQHLQHLQVWDKEWQDEDNYLLQRLEDSNPSKTFDRLMGAQIGSLRKKLKLKKIMQPIAFSMDDAKELETNFDQIRCQLVGQFAGLSKEQRKLWLNNFLFIITPDIRQLMTKIEKLVVLRGMGRERNFLLGGPARMGKTTFLDWLTLHNSATVENERNHVAVVKTDVPASTRTAKPLYQRAIWGCGKAYLKNEREEELLEKVLLYFQVCRVQLWILDEIQHFTNHELRRRIIELTNLLPGIPIICASTHPLQWIEGDPEVAGRWNDYFELLPYKNTRLHQILSFVELLLLFPEPSNLDLTEADKGCADLIEKLTRGIMQDVMDLVIFASLNAIEQNKACLDRDLLVQAWGTLQTRPATNFAD